MDYHRLDFATDELVILLSTYSPETLLENAGHEDTTLPADGVLEEFSIVSREAFKNHEERTETLRLIYQGSLDFSKVLSTSKGNITGLPLRFQEGSTISPTHAMNILIGSAAWHKGAFNIGNNKHYSEKDCIDFGIGVVAHRGYYSALKVGMGRPLLNVSRCTTAFYEALSGADFMRKYVSKPITGTFSDSDIRKLEKVLKGVRVRIEYQDRTKQIYSLGDPPKDEEFLKKDKKIKNDQGRMISVADHIAEDNDQLEDERSKYSREILNSQLLTDPEIEDDTIRAIQNSNYPCVNVGTRTKPQYIPAELVQIVKYQPFKPHLPPDAASTMIERAREEPRESRSNVCEEGLDLLGLKPGYTYTTLVRSTILSQ